MTTSSKRSQGSVLGVVVLIAIWTWAVWSWQRIDDFTDWKGDRPPKGDEAQAPLPDPPPRPALWAARATSAENNFFPPQYDRAIKATTRALWLEPLRSGYWQQLARAQLFAGEQEHSRAALSRADQLDPVWPEQRLESIRLWTLLGEPERALALGEAISRVGPHAQVQAAHELVLNGHDPMTVFERLHGKDLSGIALASFIAGLRTSDVRATERLFAAIPAREFESSEFRAAALPAVLQPLAYRIALRLWVPAFAKMGADWQPPILHIENGNLGAAPPSGIAPLGWQPLPSFKGVQASWRRREASDPPAGEGALAIRFRDPPARRTGVDRWKIYRMPVDAATSLTLSIPVKVTPPASSSCRLVFKQGSTLVGGAKSLPKVGDWQVLSLAIPPDATGKVIELEFERAVGKLDVPGAPVDVVIGPLSGEAERIAPDVH